MSHRPTVSVVIPARNEARDIAGAIDSICRQDFPVKEIELIVVDGSSTDETVRVASAAAADRGLAAFDVVTNRDATTPSNLNVGLRSVRGAYLCRVDARSRIPADYVRRCVSILQDRPEVRVVGGAQVAVPRDDSNRSVGIARALNNRFTMGLGRYRRGASSGPTDTVYLGFFRVEELREARGWNEALPTNQDFELNRRLGRSGVVWFEAGLDVEYLPRDRVGDLFAQYQRFGRAKVRYWRLTADRPRPRQAALIAAPPAALGVGLWVALRNPAMALSVAGLVGAAVVARGANRAGLPSELLAVLATGGGWTIGMWQELGARGRGSPESGFVH